MILDKFRLDGTVAVVTGGTKGVGMAVAAGFAEAGADIAVVSRTPNQALEKQILGIGRRYIHLEADLSQREQTRRVIPTILEKMGDIDILVNNAGVISRTPATQYSEADWDHTLEVDLTAPFILSQRCGQIMTQKGRGKIINIGSVLSFQGGTNVIAYAAAKHGVAGLTKALSNEWAAKGVNVNAIALSFFKTELTAAVQQDPIRSKSIVERTPAGHWGNPEDVAGAALFLAGAASDFVHGSILLIDGGWMAW